MKLVRGLLLVIVLASCSGVPELEAAPEPVGCAVLPPVSSAVSESTSEDVDGDGSEDVVTVYGEDDSEQWYLRIDYGSGFAAEASFERDTFSGVTPCIYSVFDIEGDGSLEIFLANGGGAHTEAISIFDVQPCEIKEVVYGQDQERSVLFFLDYGSLSQGGLACGDGELRNIWAYRDAPKGRLMWTLSPTRLRDAHLSGSPT